MSRQLRSCFLIAGARRRSSADDGGGPAAALTLAGNYLYGTTTSGGTQNQGTIFRLSLPIAPAATATVCSQNKMVVAWQTNSGGLTLQSSTNLLNWTPVSQVRCVVDGQTCDQRHFS